MVASEYALHASIRKTRVRRSVYWYHRGLAVIGVLGMVYSLDPFSFNNILSRLNALLFLDSITATLVASALLWIYMTARHGASALSLHRKATDIVLMRTSFIVLAVLNFIAAISWNVAARIINRWWPFGVLFIINGTIMFTCIIILNIGLSRMRKSVESIGDISKSMQAAARRLKIIQFSATLLGLLSLSSSIFSAIAWISDDNPDHQAAVTNESDRSTYRWGPSFFRWLQLLGTWLIVYVSRMPAYVLRREVLCQCQKIRSLDVFHARNKHVGSKSAAKSHAHDTSRTSGLARFISWSGFSSKNLIGNQEHMPEPGAEVCMNQHMHVEL